jgi:predicted nucleic acid-binding protein
MTLPIVTGKNEAQIEELLRNKSSFEVIGLRGTFNASIKFIETRIEHLGLKCRIKIDAKGAIAHGGILGTIIGAASLPAGVVLAAAATVVSAGHTLATYDPDYEIIKDYVNKKLKVVYKK